MKHSHSANSQQSRRHMRTHRRHHRSPGLERMVDGAEMTEASSAFDKILSTDRQQLSAFKHELRSNLYHLKLVRSSLQQLIASIDTLMIDQEPLVGVHPDHMPLGAAETIVKEETQDMVNGNVESKLALQQ